MEGPLPACATADETSFIAFDSNRDDPAREIYMVRPNGEGLRRMTDHPGVDIQPAFSHGGGQIAFTSVRGDDPNPQIFVMQVMGGAITQVTHRAEGASEASFSHDGKRIAFRSGAAVYTIAVDGSDERPVVDSLSADRSCSRPQFTSGDTELVFDRNHEIDTAALDGTNMQVLVTRWTTLIQAPMPSQGGGEFAYLTYCDADGNGSIWISRFGVRTDPCQGTRITPLGDWSSEHPSFNPVATCIAYARVDRRTEVGKIGIISCDPGSVPGSLTPGLADDRNPSWSQ
jgi:hypothetical protein